MGKVVSPKRIGEPWSEPAELVLDAIGRGKERERIATYLSNGTILISGSYWTDPVTDNPEHRIPYSLQTDGVWVWPSPWAWFVEGYGAALPADFLAHIQAQGDKPPQISAQGVREISIAEGVLISDDLFAEVQRRQREYDEQFAAEMEARQQAEGGSAQPQ
jgi:hypothetical protein